jgi:glutamate racemase
MNTTDIQNIRNRPVVFLDSGIGGIPYCINFLSRNPRETVYYIADRKNFPYGHRSKEEITGILTELTEEIIKSVNPKLIVIACNTATIAALDKLKNNFPKVFFTGTVPPIKQAAEASKKGIFGVLATEQTINYISRLYPVSDSGSQRILGIAAPELIEFIEQKFETAGVKEKIETVKKYIDIFLSKGADTLVLGCTHFLHLSSEFKQEADGKITIIDSLEEVTNNIEMILDVNDGVLRAGKESRAEKFLLITGTDQIEELWQKRAQALGFNLSLLCEI